MKAILVAVDGSEPSNRATQHAIDHRQTHLVRPRVLIYGGLLATLITGFIVTLALRSPVSLDVIRDRNALYRESRPGYIENVYTLRIINKAAVWLDRNREKPAFKGAKLGDLGGIARCRDERREQLARPGRGEGARLGTLDRDQDRKSVV